MPTPNQLRKQRSAALPFARELPDTFVPGNPTIILIRVSSRKLKASEFNAGKQTDSPETQLEAIRKFCAARGYVFPTDERFIFIERKSGKRFAKRDVYQEVRAFVARNPRTDKATVICYDVDRFSRELKENEKPNISAVMTELEFFVDKGWHVDFVQSPMERAQTGDLGPYITLVVKAWGAAEYSRVLGERVRDAKAKSAARGAMIGGVVPYPARRLDKLTRRPLAPGEWTPNGSVLDRDPALYPSWEYAARQVALGKSCGQVAEELIAMNAPTGPYMRAAWSHHAVRRMLTNTQLIAKPVYDITVNGGATDVEADWEPVVDTALFAAANEKLRAVKQANRRRTALRSDFLLEPVCEACGLPYYPDDWTDPVRYPGVIRPRYIHRAVSTRSGGKGDYTKARECGCRAWSFDAKAAEAGIRDLIAKRRTSPEFIDDMLAMRATASSRLETAREFERQRETAYNDAEASLTRFLRNLRVLDIDPDDAAEVARVRQEKKDLEALVESSKRAWHIAREQTAEVSREPDGFQAMIDFTRQVLNVWDEAPYEDRKAVFDHWIDAVQVLPGRKQGKRANTDEVVLVVHLRTNPEKAHAVTIVQAVEEAHQKRGERPSRADVLLDKDAASRSGDAVEQCVVVLKAA